MNNTPTKQEGNMSIFEMPNHTWLYNMIPFKTQRLGHWMITRVPGGWIFELPEAGYQPLFVPFNNDLQDIPVETEKL